LGYTKFWVIEEILSKDYKLGINYYNYNKIT
jgi:hypothetical protein